MTSNDLHRVYIAFSLADIIKYVYTHREIAVKRARLKGYFEKKFLGFSYPVLREKEMKRVFKKNFLNY